VLTAFQGIRHQLCPRCRQGAIFRLPLWRGFLAMYERCPVCNLKFEREPGYFLGALYFSYALSIPPGLILVLLLWRLTRWPFDWVMFGAFIAYLPLVPVVTRWSRVLWLYVDWHFDPGKSH
jgi:uncharacterized protein (DUF983 family)